MDDSCVCDFGDGPDVQHIALVKARKAHRCYECPSVIAPGSMYERANSLYDGAWTRTAVCSKCLDVRDYITAHAPCFCWLYGSMLDDAKATLQEYGHVSAGFFIGGMKRVLRAERQRRTT